MWSRGRWVLVAAVVAGLLVSQADAKKKKKKSDEGKNDIEFKNLDDLKPEDSWLDLDTWNPMRVGEFITHLEQEFPDIGLSGALWQEKSVTGSFLKTQIWGDLDQKMLDHMKFSDNAEKFVELGFSEDIDVQKEQIKRVRARIDREYMRRRDAKFRKNLMKNKEERKIKAAKKLDLQPGELPTFEAFTAYKVKQLRLLFESQGLDPQKHGKEVEELRQKAIEEFFPEHAPEGAKKKGKKKKKRSKGKKTEDEEEL